MNNLLSGKSPTSHTHDDRYYTESEIVNLLTGKANSYHTHDASQISGVLPANKGGTGVTSIDALKNVLGIGSSGNSMSKIVAGSYTGKYNQYTSGSSRTQTITVNGLTTLVAIIVVSSEGLFGWQESARDPMIHAAIAGININNTNTSTPGLSININTNTFAVSTYQGSYGGIYLNNEGGSFTYLAFGN